MFLRLRRLVSSSTDLRDSQSRLAAQPRDQIERYREGRALPHCRAAKPQQVLALTQILFR